MNRLREQFKKETGKGAEIPDYLGQPVTFSEPYVLWLESKITNSSKKLNNDLCPDVSKSVNCDCKAPTYRDEHKNHRCTLCDALCNSD